MIEYIKLMRPQHYIKNVLIFLPLMFGGALFDMDLLLKTGAAFLVFNFSASFVYIINDINDAEFDRKHPIKKDRPIASGKISKKAGIIFSAVLFGIILLINFAYFKDTSAFSKSIPYIYIAINLFYSFKGKKIPIVDIFILATGFILRVVYGGEVTGIEISSWLYLTIFSLSFYLGLGKRRNEINTSGEDSRLVLKVYNYQFLDKNMIVFLTSAIVFYALWCVNYIELYPNARYIIFSVPLVMVICMKYSLIIEGDSLGDPIEVFLKDWVLIFLVFVYGIVMFFTIYS